MSVGSHAGTSAIRPRVRDELNRLARLRVVAVGEAVPVVDQAVPDESRRRDRKNDPRQRKQRNRGKLSGRPSTAKIVRSSPPATSSAHSLTYDRMRHLFLGGLVAILVATPLIPGESAAEAGTHLPLAMLGLLLGVVWFGLCAVKRWRGPRWGWLDLLVVALAAWQVLSVLVMGPSGAIRPAINMGVHAVNMAAVWVLLRQLVDSRAEVRAVVVVFVGLATCIGSLALYQYYVTLPAVRAAYEADPEAAFRAEGIVTPPPVGSPQRELFEQRLFSTEPLGTFALTNSLAGFLLPWCLLAACIGAAAWRARDSLTIAGAAAVTVMTAWVLLLTQSRSAWVSVAVIAAGTVFLRTVFPRRHQGTRRHANLQRLEIGAGCSALALGMIWWVRNLSPVAAAWQSLHYRLEYWYSSWGIIADYPVLGCGPGNFQDYYTSYQLPQSSETVADPHNFLIETAATAGLPAVLILATVVVMILVRAMALTPADTPAAPVGEQYFSRHILFGGVTGIALAYVVGLVVGFPPDIVVVLMGAPLGAAAVLGLLPWVRRGELTSRMLVVPPAALGIHWLASGGINIPGVAVVFWMLLALFLLQRRFEQAEPNQQEHGDHLRNHGGESNQPQWPKYLAAGCFAVTALACYFFAYSPVLRGNSLVERAGRFVADSRLEAHRDNVIEAQQLLLAGEQMLEEATAVDPWSHTPPMHLARLEHQRLLAESLRPGTRLKPADARGMTVQLSAALRLRQRASRLYREAGFMLLTPYESDSQSPVHESALDMLRRGVELFPSNAQARAELAWAYHVSGRPELARQEARQALALDAAHNHRERKLANRRLFDSVGDPMLLGAMKSPSYRENLRTLMESLAGNE